MGLGAAAAQCAPLVPRQLQHLCVFAITLLFIAAAGLKDWALVDGLPFPRGFMRSSSWWEAGFLGVWQLAASHLMLVWPAAKVFASSGSMSAVSICWLFAASAVALGYLRVELSCQMARSYQPQKSIWETWLLGAIIMSLLILGSRRSNAIDKVREENP